MSSAFYEEDSAAIGNIYDRRLVGRLLGYVRPYRLAVAISVVLMLLIAAVEIVGPLILREAIDGQIMKGRTDRLGALTFMFLAALTGSFITRYAQMILMAYVGQRVMVDLRVQMFSHLQRMSVSFFDRNPIGRLVTRLTNDIATIEQTVSLGLVSALTNVLMVGAIMVVLFLLDWRLALVVYIFLPPLIFGMRRLASAQRLAFREQRMWIARINAYLNEIISGIAVVQLFNRERENLRRFDHRNQGTLQANLRVLFWYAVLEPTVVIFGALITAAILWYGGVRVVDNALTLGTLVAFIAYVQRFVWPIRELSDRYAMLQQAMASAERIFGVLDEEEEIADPPDPVHLTDIQGRIEFRDVWFAYGQENWVLRGISMEIEPAESVAIVGVTGAGKSTMMALLSRLYDVQRGEILVDGVPIRRIPQRELRRHVGIMLQDPFVYTDTVLENIRLRDESITMEQVQRAARLVGADSFIDRMPQRYDTVLSERGANLSTGQKQLIALARVAAFDPKIVLVMDEATASIDPETEALIQRGLAEVMSERTSIIIAHRLNTIRGVDRVIVLDQGMIVEEGRHEELLALNGYYSRLYSLQYRRQEDAVTGS